MQISLAIMVCSLYAHMAMIDRQAFYNDRAALCVRETDRHYHKLLMRYFRFLVPAGSRVIEIGCGLGDLLASLEPSYGVGVDFSPRIIELARDRHPNLEFHVADACEFSCAGGFDYILMSDLVNDLPDVQAAVEHLHTVAHGRTRLILNSFNNLWLPVLAAAEKFGAKAPKPPSNWLSKEDLSNLLHLAGWEIIKVDGRIVWPVNTLFISTFLNRWVAPLVPQLCLALIIVARPKPRCTVEPHYRCSVVIPARNEAENIEAVVKRTPKLGLGTEIVFVEGHSTDHTWEEINRVAAQHPQSQIKILKQKSVGKGGAVREGFAGATGDLLFILDADLSVPPEELTKFYNVAQSGTAEFVNGVRLVYPMEDKAMQFLNMVANKAFSLAFSWLLGQHLKDTLCGTKVLFRKDYLAITRNRAYFGDFDPFGDFDLIFGAAKLNLRMMDLPIRYRARIYGKTNIQRWRHGWLLLRMVLLAARRLKFFT